MKSHKGLLRGIFGLHMVLKSYLRVRWPQVGVYSSFAVRRGRQARNSQDPSCSEAYWQDETHNDQLAVPFGTESDKQYRSLSTHYVTHYSPWYW